MKRTLLSLAFLLAIAAPLAAQSTITRTTWTDDDGSGTVGTIINNAQLQLIYDKIDLLISGTGAYTTLTFGGNVKVGSSGTGTLTAGIAALANAATITMTGAASVTPLVLVNNRNTTNDTTTIAFNDSNANRSAIISTNVNSGNGSGKLTFQVNTGSALTSIMTLDNSGLFSVLTAGTHTFTAGSSTSNRVDIVNTTSGTTAQAQFRVTAGTNTSILATYSQGYTTGTVDIQNSTLLQAAGAGGLSFYASDAAGVMRFFPAGTTERGRIYASGGFAWGVTLADPGANNFQVGGTANFVGQVFVGDASAATPGLVFSSDSDTGFFRSTSKTIGFASRGVQVATITRSLAGSHIFTMTSSALGTGTIVGPEVVIGRNASGSGTAGALVLTQLDGGSEYLWVDNSADPGVLRISTAPPEEDGTPADTSGTVVGTQTSTRASKNILGRHTNAKASLDLLLRTPVWDFTYKGGSYNHTRFVGITTDDSPEFGMDLNRSFNPVSAFGHTVLAIQELQREIDALKKQVARR